MSLLRYILNFSLVVACGDDKQKLLMKPSVVIESESYEAINEQHLITTQDNNAGVLAMKLRY